MKKLSCLLILAACGGSEPKPVATPTPAPTQTTASATQPPAEASTGVTAEAPKPAAEAAKAPTPALTWAGLKTPECVVYDADADRYLVSNIDGKPLDADGNGFISELSPDGKISKLKFIEGNAKAPLNAPKGMVIVKGTLYVADIDTVRMYDAKTGASKGALPVKGAAFLNDVAAAPDGRIFISDTGVDAKFETTGADAIYQIKGGKISVYIKDKDLSGPNGLSWTGFGLAVATFSKAEVFVINDAFVNRPALGSMAVQAKFVKLTKTPNGGLDGLIATDKDFWVSSWGGKAIYKGAFEGDVKPVLEGIEAPADFAYDTKRNRIIVPRFMADKVEAYDVK
jgi:sugar lactone lactonase YvrE